jgi:hypothetical protein
VREFQLRDGIGTSEAAGDGRTDRAKTENADTTTVIAVGGTATRGLERVQRHLKPLYQRGKNPCKNFYRYIYIRGYIRRALKAGTA